MWKLSLFGIPALERSGRPQYLPRRKARALLAYLAVTQQVHSREWLAALLWPEYDHRSGRADLSRMLSSLRSTLGADFFLTDRESVALSNEVHLLVDVLQFREELDAFRETDVANIDDNARQKLVATVDLYQTDFLAGFTLPDSPAFDEWQLLQTEALRRDLGWALDKLIHTYEDRNNFDKAIVYAQRWVGLDPLHESAQRRLISLYTRNGQRAEAHHQYLVCARLLKEELGVEPNPETKQLYELIGKSDSKKPLIGNRFQLVMKEENLLGQGDTGQVYRGLDTKLNRQVAIKVVRPDAVSERPELLDRFVHEGKALRRLGHPNIVKMIAAVKENDRHYLIMEYINGRSLKEWLARQGSLPITNVLEIGLGLADALAQAHHLNIIHQNIKPANVLLAGDGIPRLTDFGLARRKDISQSALNKAMFDSEGYLSPEACQGEMLDARSDIWSLGVLLVEMLTGEHPFRGDSPEATTMAILNRPATDFWQRYSHIPQPLADLISRMLVKDREGRLPSMRLLGAELEAIQHGRSLTTPTLPKKLEQEIRYFFSFDGVRIAYATVGSGPPLVLAATYLRHLEYEWQSPVWQHWLEALASDHTLIRYDERACGLSDWNVSDISFEAWVRDLEALVDHLGLEGFPIMALSQGGPVAIAYAARHPDIVSHLILHGAYARGRFHRQDSPQGIEEAQTLLSLMKLGWGRDNPAFRQVFSMQLMPDANKEQLVWFDELMRVSMSSENAVRAETEMYKINVQDLLPQLSVPTLVAHCRYDESIPFAEGRLLASQIPGARLVPLESKNHLLLPNELAWKQFVREIHNFIAPAPRLSLGNAPTIPRFDRLKQPSETQHTFVGRTRELAQLNSHLDEALAGNGHIIFLTGGAGRGKTSLLEEFTSRALKTHSEIIAAGGSGNAVAGAGDPYLPFREVLSQLTGDITTRGIGGQMSVEQARRLWAIVPQTTQAILEHGPQLLNVLVSGRQLLSRATAAVPASMSWLAALQAEVTRLLDAPGAIEQWALFGQFTIVLQHLAQKRPLLITLDDLQWIDQASIGLLFHLGRRLGGSRILIIGAYRPDEIPQGRNGDPNPLIQILDEFKRIYGDIFIDLAHADQSEGRAFVEAFLDTEPNRLDTTFRQALFQQTGGHPLFTVELLRDMQNRGDLIQDEKGQWFAGQELDWTTFPARIEAVISSRVERLDEASRAILEVASVEGEHFAAEVVAQALGIDEGLLLHSLTHQLGNLHRLVRERGEIKSGTAYLSSYQFRHALFQQYLYQQLSPGERRRLHGAVAGALATLYAGDLDQVIVQLAHHYTAAGDWNEAVYYHRQAGDSAFRKATLPDAARHYHSALAHWPNTDEVGKAQIQRKLGECLWILGKQLEAVDTLQASYDLSQRLGDKMGAGATQRLMGRVYWESGHPDKARYHYQQAISILESEPESEEYAWALAGMCNYLMQLSEYEESIKLGERSLEMARRLGAEGIVIQCLCDLGSALSSMGNWEGIEMERESLALALESKRPHDAGRAYLYISEALMYLGHYDQARDTLNDALSYTRRFHVPFITEAAAWMLSEIEWLTGNWSTTLSNLQPLSDQVLYAKPDSLSQIYLKKVIGLQLNDLGQAEMAQKLLTDALDGPVNSLDPRVAFLGELARAQAARGQVEAAISAIKEILEWTRQAPYLYPNVGMALLFICRSPVTLDQSRLVAFAQTARQELERLEKQYGTPATAAYHLEGQGWLRLGEADAPGAIDSFEGAAALWQKLGHPYDHARTLSGLVQAMTQAGDREAARSASEQAMGLLDSLTAQLKDQELRKSFLDSELVKRIRTTMVLS
jgi:adenylate cyclase